MFKIKIMILTLLVLVFTNSYSQVNVKLGIESGVDVSNSNITPEFTTNNRTGLILGGVLDLSFNKNISVVSGLRYIQKGYSFVTTDNNVRTNVTNEVNFIQIPALLKYKFPMTEVNPYLITGPILGIKVHAAQEVTRNSTTTRTDIDGLTESTELSYLIGGGLDFNLSSGNQLFLQAGYEFGLTDIDKVNNNVTIKPNLFQVTGGIKFGL